MLSTYFRFLLKFRPASPALSILDKRASSGSVRRSKCVYEADVCSIVMRRRSVVVMAFVRRIPPVAAITVFALCAGLPARAQQPAAGAQAPPITAAQAPSPTQAPRAGAPAAPTMRFAPEGISLEEAVRITLQNDPNIQRQQATVQFNEGVVQEQVGPFDLTLLGNLGYEHRVQELTEARKQTERDKRNQLSDFLNQNRASADRARAIIPVLDALRSSNASPASIQQLATIDQSLASMIQLFDDLIAANAGNPAIANDLRTQRSNFITNTLADFEQSMKDQIAGFDAAQQRLINLGDAPTDEVFYRAGFEVQLSKLFRNGVRFGPYLNGSYEGTNYKGKPRSEEFGGKGLEDLFTFHAGTDLFVPLGRGRGARAVDAGERAAIRERDAARLALEHQASASALATILAYWDVRAAADNADVIQRSIDIQSNLLQLTQQLINSGDLPRVELSRAQAADARVRAQFADAQRQLHEARVALALAMGVAVTGDEATIPRARDPFPPAPAAAPLPTAAMIPDAVQRRKDVEAAAAREQAGRVLQDAASTNLRMRADLIGDTWYTALEERSIQRAIDRWVGPSGSLQLALEKPLGNNLYRGQLTQREADVRARQIDATDLQRQIGLGVVQAASALPDALARLRQAQASVGFYNDIVNAEIARFRTGDATLIDTVIMQQQQNESQLALIAAEREVGRLIAQLRFQTGTLLTPEGAVSGANLTTLPQPGGAR
jgi:outer membrane protein TolC